MAGWRSEIATTVSALASITNTEAVSAGRRVRNTIVASSAMPVGFLRAELTIGTVGAAVA